MASLDEGFDPAAVEPRDSIEPVPPGEYTAQIIASDIVFTKAGTGEMINLTWEITDGEYANRKFWQRINYMNQSAVAQKIGQQQLAEICAAVGLAGHMSDTEELHSQPVRVRVAIDAKDANYAPKNEVKAVKPLTAEPPAGKPAPQPAPRAKAPAAATAAPAARPAASRPWGNRPGA